MGRDETQGRLEGIERDIMTSRYKTVPYRHQIECLNRFARREYFALLAEMGTGKTWIAINNLAELWSSGDCFSALIFAPNGVHINWVRNELPKHMPDWVRYRAFCWRASMSKEDEREFRNFNAPSFEGELQILLMNHEALQFKRGFEVAESFCKFASKLAIIIDESDAFKNPSAARTKSLMKLKKYSHWRRIMSGTPINNSPFDAYSQFNFLDESILGCQSFYAFKSEYADMIHDGDPRMIAIKRRSGTHRVPQVVEVDKEGRPRFKNLDKLNALIAPHSFRILKKECLDLPEKIYETIYFEMTPEQRKAYKLMEDECRLVFNSEESVVSKLTALTKLTQITSGYFIHPGSKDPIRIEGGNPKIDRLEEQVERIVNAGEQVIIWARYRVEINDIAYRLERFGCKTLHGETPRDLRMEYVDDFQRGAIRVLVANQQVGGTGLTLTNASEVIYFSNNFSLRDRMQSEDRAHRIGQTKNVTYTNLIASGTVDEKIVWCLNNKKDIADVITSF